MIESERFSTTESSGVSPESTRRCAEIAAELNDANAAVILHERHLSALRPEQQCVGRNGQHGLAGRAA